MDYLYDGNGTLYGLIYNGNKYFYLRDHLANILGIIDSSGNLVVSYDYSAYGKIKSITGSMASTLGQDKDYRNRKERSLFEAEKSAFENPIRIFAR